MEIKMAGVISDREKTEGQLSEWPDLCAVHTTCFLIQSHFHFKLRD